MRASCFRTSSMVSSRRAWRLMASRTSRSVSASTRRSRSVSTVACGLVCAAPLARDLLADGVEGLGAVRLARGGPAASRPRGAAGRYSCVGPRARMSSRATPLAIESGRGRPAPRAHPVRLHRQRGPQPHRGGPLPRTTPATRCGRRGRRPSPRPRHPRAAALGRPRVRDVRAGGPAPDADQAALPGAADRPVVDLDVEDRWRRGDPELVRRVLRSLRPHLGAPRKIVMALPESSGTLANPAVLTPAAGLQLAALKQAGP